MKQVIYYLYVARMAFIGVLVFAWAVGTEYFWPAIISAVIGIVLLCIGKSDVGEITGDERTRRINENHFSPDYQGSPCSFMPPR